MYTVIRRYEGLPDSAEVAKRATEEFGPILSEQPGFLGYWVVDAGDGVLASISIFDTKTQAEESTEEAADWVSKRLAGLVPNAPMVMEGVTTGVGASVAA